MTRLASYRSAIAILMSALVAVFASWRIWGAYQERMTTLSDQRQKLELSIAQLQSRRNARDAALAKLDPAKAVKILPNDDVVSALRSRIASAIQSNIVDIRLETPLPQPLPQPFALASITLRLPSDHQSIDELAQKLDALQAPIRLVDVSLRPAPRRFGSSNPEAVSLELLIRGRVLLSTAGGRR